MTYELCKKLKDAGFARIYKDGSYYFLTNGVRILFERIKDGIDDDGLQISYEEKLTTIPTLFELIKACGKRFVNLKQYPTIEPKGNEPDELRCSYNRNYLKDNRWEWEAVGILDGNAENMKFTKKRADTPEEAVANLWLELNKNDYQ